MGWAQVTTTLSAPCGDRGGAGLCSDVSVVSIGVRKTEWSAATGFHLNGVPTKILGAATVVANPHPWLYTKAVISACHACLQLSLPLAPILRAPTSPRLTDEENGV